MPSSPRLALKAAVMLATSYTLNELFHSALPSEYDVCSSNETHKLRYNELTQYLNRRGYNVGFLNQKIQRVHTITRTDTLKPSDAITDSPTRISLVAGYNPALPSISSIFHKYIHILSSFQRSATVFKSIPFVPFRSTNKPEVRESRTSR